MGFVFKRIKSMKIPRIVIMNDILLIISLGKKGLY